MTDNLDMASLIAEVDELVFDEPEAPAKPARKPRKKAAKAEPTPAPAPAAPPAATAEPLPEIDLSGLDFLEAAPAPAPAPAGPPAADPLAEIDLSGLDFLEAAPAAPVAATPVSAPAPAPAPTAAPVPPAAPTVAAAPVAAAPAAIAPPAAAPSPRVALMTKLLVGLCVVSSFASLGGLLTVSRSVAAAEAQRAAAAEEREKLEHLNQTAESLAQSSKALAAILARAPAVATPPASAEDVRQAMDGLKMALSKQQPDGVAPLAGMIRDGLGDVIIRLNQIDAALDQHAGTAPAPRRRPAD
ncbi:hypothetical protein [Sphingomonas morindae]|uniref:Translation initiation factor 2 n=1 Tax=Sphingomonas morindae TaxID=1541170 RepID=A0ABY4XA34_9SPHN|nr:hypothetical protein [Sphingomonas morindae]USI73728.1 hypothetical protein LHA26_04450 [Sphingomonas morindae]